MRSDNAQDPVVTGDAAGGMAAPAHAEDAIPAAAPVHPRRKAALFLLTGLYTLNFLDRQIILILQEPIRMEFGLQDWHLGLLTGGAFGLFYTAMSIPIAHMLDRGANRVKMIAIMVAVWSLMTAFCGIARNFVQLLIARMGVGLAESGFTPASHSLLSDLYSPRERPQAMGVFVLGTPIGAMIGMALGGYLAEAMSWRVALLIAGIPGILIAILMPLIVREPARGASEVNRPATAAEPVPFLAALQSLFRRPAFVHVIMASAVCAFVQMGMLAFLPSLLVRVHGLSLTTTGLVLGLLSGICGTAGTYLGGWQATRMGGKGLHRMIYIPALGLAIAAPIYAAMLFAPTATLAIALLVLPMALVTLWSAPSIALTQSLAPVPIRARASAVYIVCANLLGVSMGPMAAGALSSWFASFTPDAGVALRNALLVMLCLYAWAITHWLLAARAIRREAQAGGAQGFVPVQG